MLRIRLKRAGARDQASFRIVVADSRAARDGRFVEQIGHYNPRTDPPTIVVDEDKTLKWIRQGAQPSDSVKRLLRGLGTLDRVKAE